ncbi:pachytene checkpoint protein 2 homolog [Nannochloropsis oceanica]
MTSMELGALSLNPTPPLPPTPSTPPFASSACAPVPPSSSSSSSSSTNPSKNMKKIDVHIEARQAITSAVLPSDIKKRVLSFLQSHVRVYRLGPLGDFASLDPYLGEHVQCIVITELGNTGQETAVSSWRALSHVYVYAVFGGQHALLSLAESSMLFSNAGVDPTLVSGNRLMLLYGAPGTGKTSLSRGLAQKLAIRHGESFAAVELLSVNAHALLSKFFGESSSLVGRMFGSVREKVAEEKTTLFVLAIDEVETMCSSRSQALSKGTNEPSDAVRVVNAVLTEMDRLKAFRNVLTVATSNVTQALDEAFLDRCDLKLHVGLPRPEGRYAILRSALVELMRCGVIIPRMHLPERVELLPSLAAATYSTSLPPQHQQHQQHQQHNQQRQQQQAPGVRQLLLQLVERTEGMSGRGLRKLPLLAHSLMAAPRTVGLDVFLGAMDEAVRQGRIERE